jgi:dolichyl-phosphate beta-glucosyltransferase
MLEAIGCFQLFMDADHSVKIDYLEDFLKYLNEGHDVVIASIELEGAEFFDENLQYRRFLGKLSKFLIRFLATPGIYDTQRGFKIFNKKASQIIFNKLSVERWGFDIESLIIARKHGLRIKEVPVSWVNSRASSVNLGSYFFTLYELVKILSKHGRPTDF